MDCKADFLKFAMSHYFPLQFRSGTDDFQHKNKIKLFDRSDLNWVMTESWPKYVLIGTI